VRRPGKEKTGGKKRHSSSSLTPFSPFSYSSFPRLLPPFSAGSPPSVASSPGSGGNACNPTLLPTPVVPRKSRIDWVQRSVSNPKRLFPLPVALLTSAQRVFFYIFHSVFCIVRSARPGPRKGLHKIQAVRPTSRPDRSRRECPRTGRTLAGSG